MASLARKAAAGFWWVALSKYVTRFLGFLTTLVLAKLLAPEDFGLVALAAMLINVLTIFKDMGLGQALIYRREETGEASDTAFYLLLGLNTMLFLLAAALAPLAASFYDNALVAPIVILMSTNLIFIALRGVPDALIRRNVDFKKLVVPEIAPVVVGAAVGVWMAYAGYGVWSLVVKGLIVDVIATVMIWKYTNYRPAWRFDKQVARELLTYGKYIVGTSIFAVALYNIDRFYVSKMEGLAVLGIYTLALTIANIPVSEFGHLVCRVIFPVFSRVNHDAPALRAAFTKTFRYNASATIPMAVGLMVWGPAAVGTFLDERWSGIAVPLQILAFAALLRSLSVVIHEVLRAQGNPQVVQRFVIYRLVGIGGLGVPALMLAGLEGLCWLTAGTYLTVLLWEFAVVARALALLWADGLKALLRPSVLSVVAIVGSYALLQWGSYYLGGANVFVGVAIAVIAYAALVYLFDRALVQGIRQYLLPQART